MSDKKKVRLAKDGDVPALTHDEVERQIIGAVLFENAFIQHLPEDWWEYFRSPAIRVIAEAINARFRNGDLADPVLISEEVKLFTLGELAQWIDDADASPLGFHARWRRVESLHAGRGRMH